VSVDLSVDLFGVKFKNPLIVSACPVTRDSRTAKRIVDAGIGGVVTKTLSRVPAVDPRPAVARLDDFTVINAEKWSQLSYERWLNEEIPNLKKLGIPVIVSIGLSPEDAELITPLVKDSGADIIELVSYNAENIVPMVETARPKTDLPILVKLSANWPNLFDVAVKAVENGADGITAIDSMGPVLAINIETTKPYLGVPTGEGWISGKPIKPYAVRAVAGIAQRVNVPILGVGGIYSAKDVIEMILVGAYAVQLCTVFLTKGPRVISEILNDMKEWMSRHGYSSLNDFRGIALRNIAKIG